MCQHQGPALVETARGRQGAQKQGLSLSSAGWRCTCNFAFKPILPQLFTCGNRVNDLQLFSCPVFCYHLCIVPKERWFELQEWHFYKNCSRRCKVIHLKWHSSLQSPLIANCRWNLTLHFLAKKNKFQVHLSSLRETRNKNICLLNTQPHTSWLTQYEPLLLCTQYFLSFKKKKKKISHSLAIPCFPIDLVFHLLGVASCFSENVS